MTPHLAATEPHVIGPNETLDDSMDFTLWLDNSITLASITSITSDPPGLVFENEAVNVGTFKNSKGGTVAIGKGITFDVSGATLDTNYVVTALCVTSNGKTREGVGIYHCRNR